MTSNDDSSQTGTPDPSEGSGHEKRHFTRITFGGQATVDCPGGPCTGQVADISLKGALVRRPGGWPGLVDRTTPAELDIELESGLRLTASARVSHVQGELAGFEFVQLPLETASELRRLVEFNLGDEALLERELAALVENHEAADRS
ncbi:PilZ domain-containing protein [Thiohalospira halophila DSM 15071]|uniref:PilZ domain-containing protein n=1 Tax=Thiohalospira halophila DSM 15071 TaxID=1123397 RepID=A0A1I1UEY5_9GAMM|nr:PilZ domain-containing protein [Thiohalospira halophila]SFD69297.1 PilZ domain-containing protein [Thiohalospira halophila DSM 15071]